jgi:hypothetical protein
MRTGGVATSRTRAASNVPARALTPIFVAMRRRAPADPTQRMAWSGWTWARRASGVSWVRQWTRTLHSLCNQVAKSCWQSSRIFSRPASISGCASRPTVRRQRSSFPRTHRLCGQFRAQARPGSFWRRVSSSASSGVFGSDRGTGDRGTALCDVGGPGLGEAFCPLHSAVSAAGRAAHWPGIGRPQRLTAQGRTLPSVRRR